MAALTEPATSPGPSAWCGSRNPDVWVIVPAFNEASVIRGVINRLLTTFSNVVAVDDGSLDDTTGEIRETAARLVRHPENLGMGAALQTGIEFALLDPTAQYFVTFDGDGQHRASDALAMVNRLRLGDENILLGSRFLGSAEGLGYGRRTLLRGARWFERHTTGLRLTDAHNGLRAFSRAFAVQVTLTHPDMAHASELIELVAASGLPYAEHAVTVDYTDYSRSKGQSAINSVNIAVDIMLRQLLAGNR